MTVPRARQRAGKDGTRRRREIARGVVVELPDRATAGGWRVRTYSPLYWPVYVGRHRADSRAERRAGKHRRQR